MRVLDSEAFQVHDWIAVGDVVSIHIRVEQQIRRVQNVKAASVERKRRGDTGGFEKDRMLVVPTVAACVFVNGNPICASRVIRWCHRCAVVNSSPIGIAAEHLQASRIRVLNVLSDPQSTAFVELHRERLADVGFGEHLFKLKTIGDFKLLS